MKQMGAPKKSLLNTIVIQLSILLFLCLGAFITFTVGVFRLHSVTTQASSVGTELSSTMALTRSHVTALSSSGQTLMEQAKPVLVHAEPLLKELRQHVHGGGDIVERGQSALAAVHNLISSVNSSNVALWTSSLTPTETMERWDAAVRAIMFLSNEIENVLHTKITLSGAP